MHILSQRLPPLHTGDRLAMMTPAFNYTQSARKRLATARMLAYAAEHPDALIVTFDQERKSELELAYPWLSRRVILCPGPTPGSIISVYSGGAAPAR